MQINDAVFVLNYSTFIHHFDLKEGRNSKRFGLDFTIARS